MASQPTRLVLLGKQGAGKGTQASRLSRHYGIPHVSTGDMFRAAARSGSDLGEKVRSFMDAGELVPDEVVIECVSQRIGAEDVEEGFLLDGFPRNVAQAEALEKLLAPEGISVVVDLVVPLEVALERLAGRMVCVDCGTNYGASQPPKEPSVCDNCGGRVEARSDDGEATIARRLALYEEQTKPLVAWYDERGKLVEVDADAAPDQVTARLTEAIDQRLPGTG